MAIEVPQYRTFNMGNVLRNRANINAMQDRSDLIKKRKKANEIRQQIDSMPEQVKKLEEIGDFETAEKVRSSYIKTKKASLELIKAHRDFVDADNYKLMRQQWIQEGLATPEMMPVNYSDSFFIEQEAKIKNDLKKISFRDGNQTTDMLVDSYGETVKQGQPYSSNPSKKTGGQGKSWQMKPSDSSEIFKRAAGLFGGRWDPITERFIGLEKDTEKKAFQIAEEASRIFIKESGARGHHIPVGDAARILIPDMERLSGRPEIDPFGVQGAP